MKPSLLQIAGRVTAALLGGYAFVWGCVTFGIALSMRAGMSYGDAQTLVFLFAFLGLLIVFCWSFVAASLARVWSVLAGGGALMTGLGWLLARTATGS